jgi:hypothetical protein
MKKLFLSLLLTVFACIGANATITYNMEGTDYLVDTLFHAKAGPGSTQTSLWVRNNSTLLRVFYATIDLSNPYVSLGAVCATDKVAGNEKISSMAKRKSQPGSRYYIGINGDFFYTSGSTGRGVSKVGTPVGTTICNNEVYRAHNGSSYKNFAVDNGSKLFTDVITFGGTLTNPSGGTATLSGINADDIGNNVVIYTSRYYGSTDVTTTCAEVTAKMADGYAFDTRKPFKMVVTSAPSTAGDMTIPDSAYVISGPGTGKAFVNALKLGDTVTVAMSFTVGGQKIYPKEMVSGNPKIMGGGSVLDSEADRGDADTNQPRTAVGFGNDGKTAIFLVVDGRSLISYGVRTKVLGDLLKYAGGTDGINLDGGGSSILYTSAFGVRNVPSDGIERSDANALYAISSAPDDDAIAELEFADWSLVVPKYGTYIPRFYGYNKYGVLVNDNVKGVKLSCPATLGTIKNDSTFVGTGAGTDTLTATYNGLKVTALLTIGGSTANMKLSNDSVINDTYRTYTVDVQNTIGENTMKIDPAALTWSSSDETIVKIGANDGQLKGVANGTATVTGVVGDFTGTMKVNVEKPTAHAMPVDPGLDISTWKIGMSGGKNVVSTANGDGIKVAFTGSAARSYYLRATKTLKLWSLPDTLRVRFNPGDVPVKAVVFAMRPNGGNISYQTVTPDTVYANSENTVDLPTASWCDANNMGNYPLTLNYIQFTTGASTSGVDHTFLINAIENIYSAIPISGITTIDNDAALDVVAYNGIITFSRVVDEATVYDLQGRVLNKAVKAGKIAVGNNGVYVISVKIDGKTITRKVML